MRLGPAGGPLLNLGSRVARTRGALAALCGLTLLLAAGCGGAASPGGAVSSTIVIAAEPGVSDAAIYLAQKDGLFAAEGLAHVRIQAYPNQQAELNALQAGQADIAASDYGNVFYWQAQYHDLRILADGYDATAGSLEILTLPGSSIKTPADLANPNVAIGEPADDWLGPKLTSAGAPASLDAAAATQVITNFVGPGAAESMQSDGQWHPMPQQREVSELADHKLQAILVSEPYIYQAESELGAVELLDAASGSTAGLPLLGYVAQDAWVRQNSAAVADFQAAMAKADANASLAGQVQAVLPGATHMSVQDADLITVGSYPTSTSVQDLEGVVRLMGDQHMINTNSTVIANRVSIKAMLVGSGN